MISATTIARRPRFTELPASVRWGVAAWLLASFLACSAPVSETNCDEPARGGAVAPVTPPALGAEKPQDYPGLHNVVAFTDRIYSGSVPEGTAGFDTVAGMGVKTIISVDGAAPDVAQAEARGIRYIHLPIGYNGFDEARKLELAQATDEALKSGPVLIHCHHGKHRSAGAAASAAASLGLISPENGVAKMKVAGTAPNYQGLFQCAAASTPLAAAVLHGPHAPFKSLEVPQGLTKGMVEIDEMSENLKAIEKAQWQTPADHPDLVPHDQSDRIVAILHSLELADVVATKPAGFREGLRSAQREAETLSQMLTSGREAAELSAQFKKLSTSCKDCHGRFRD